MYTFSTHFRTKTMWRIFSFHLPGALIWNRSRILAYIFILVVSVYKKYYFIQIMLKNSNFVKILFCLRKIGDRRSNGNILNGTVISTYYLITERRKLFLLFCRYICMLVPLLTDPTYRVR